MTAILRPGDRIHLAIPLTPRMATPDQRASAERESLAEGRSSYEFLKAEYAAQGVDITVWHASQSITVPTVIAVFRGPLPSTGMETM